MKKLSLVILSLILAVFILAGCSKGTGTLVLQITDAPADFNIEKVVVTLSKVQVHMAESENVNETNSTTEAGWITIVEEPQTFDLIAIKDVKEFLGTKELAPGKYTQIRLTVDKALVTVDGVESNLEIPSEKIKLIQPFTITEGGTTTLTLDFDAENSIIKNKTGYKMNPTIKVIQEVSVVQ